MKRILSLLLLVALALPAIALGTATPTDLDIPQEVYTISGVAVEVTGEYIVIEDENGMMIQVNISSGDDMTTVIETSKESGIVTGDFIIAMYNGMMTRSLPAQITAQKILCFEKTGIVSDITEEGFTLTTEEDEEILVNALPEQLASLVDGAEMTVYFDGVMTLSLPAQISALYITEAVEDVYTLSGTVTEVTDEYIVIGDAVLGEVQVNFISGDEATVVETSNENGIAAGDFVTVTYNGMMTRSLPPQVSALRITCFTLTGTVSEITEEGFTLVREELDEVIVHASEELMASLQDASTVTVYFDGAMTMSLPAQISAQMIVAETAGND